MSYHAVREFSFAGVGPWPKISDTNGDFLFYANHSNILLADDLKLLEVIVRYGAKISVLKSVSYKEILVGDEKGAVNIYELEITNRISCKKCDIGVFASEIVDCAKVDDYIVVCLLDEIIVVKDAKIVTRYKTEEFISCLEVLNIKNTKFAEKTRNTENHMFGFSNKSLDNQQSDQNRTELIKIDIPTTCSYDFVLVINYDNAYTDLFVFKNNKLAKIKSFKIHQDTVTMAKFYASHNKLNLCTVSLDKCVIIQRLNLETLEFENKVVLHGHQDWVYSCFWRDTNTLLTASSDNSVIVWECKKGSWDISHRLGGITEKSQIFYNAIFLKDYIICQALKGGFLKYKFQENIYELYPYVAGHQEAIVSIDTSGDFFMSASLDRTARIFSFSLYQEIARPVIHGYPLSAAKFFKNDLNIIVAAQETILRTFAPTQLVLNSYNHRINNLCNSLQSDSHEPYLRQSKGSLSSKLPQNSIKNLNIESENVFLNDENSGVKKDSYLSNASNIASKSISDTMHKLFIVDSSIPLLARNSELSLTNEICADAYEIIKNESAHEHSLMKNYLFSETKKIYGHHYNLQDIIVAKDHVFTCNLASKKSDACIKIWGNGMHLIKNLSIFELGITSLKKSNDENYIIACSRDGYVSLFKSSGNFDTLHYFKSHNRPVLDCSISTTNKYFATGSRDKQVKVYDFESGALIRFLEFSANVRALAFLDRDEILAVGLGNGEIHLIDILTSEVHQKFLAHGASVTKLLFDLSTNILLTGGEDGLVNVFRLTRQK